MVWGEQDSGGAAQRWLLTNGHSVEYHSQVRVPPPPPVTIRTQPAVLLVRRAM